MKGKQRFFICETCKNFLSLLEDKGGPMTCCGKPLTELAPNTVDASAEKHVPAVTKIENGIRVEVGSVLHPMTQEHLITFIYVETEKGGQRKSLKAGDDPIAEFIFTNDAPIAVYEYCNLHGLWKAEV